MGYLNESCDQISDFCHHGCCETCDENYLGTDGSTDGRMDRGQTVTPLRWSGGITTEYKTIPVKYKMEKNKIWITLIVYSLQKTYYTTRTYKTSGAKLCNLNRSASHSFLVMSYKLKQR